MTLALSLPRRLRFQADDCRLASGDCGKKGQSAAGRLLRMTDGAGVRTIQYPFYFCFAREMWSLVRKEISGESLATEAATLVAKWVARGLTPAVLQAIRTDVFNVAAPIGPRGRRERCRRSSAAGLHPPSVRVLRCSYRHLFRQVWRKSRVTLRHRPRARSP